MKAHNVAVIGCGIWGKNVVRNFYNLNALHTVCDLDEENRKNLKIQYPDVNIIADSNEVFNNPEIEAVAVVTPSHTHYKIVKQAIEAGKHVYVEKPISTVSAEAKRRINPHSSNSSSIVENVPPSESLLAARISSLVIPDFLPLLRDSMILR